MIKGIDNQDIFYDDQDRRVFLKHILESKKEFNYNVFAYCLMDNHVHLVIKSQKEFLSKSIQSLMIRYVHYFNTKYKRSGPLVQNRFKSKNIESQRYFLEVCRYVHRNPENAGMEKTENYQWSSYNEYIGKAKIIDKNILLHYFNNDVNEFINFTKKAEYFEDLNELAEYELIGKLTDGQLAYIVMQLFNINDVSEIPSFFKNASKEELTLYIKKLKKVKGTNITQISRVIRIDRRRIEKNW